MMIRSAKKEDFETLKKLIKAHAVLEGSNTLNDINLNELKHYIFNTAIVECLVVELNTEVIGYATFMKQFSTWDARYYLYLDCLYLNEKARGQGIGTQMMNQIKAYAKSKNYSEIQWQTPNFNKKAIDFYQKIGANAKSKERFTWKI